MMRRLVRGDPAAWNELAKGRLSLDDAGRAYLESAYRTEVAFVDRQLGLLFDSLRRWGLYDRALIMVVADHGEHLGERGLYSHSYRLDPELVEIPLLVKWPGQHEPSRRKDLVSLVDLFPTILTAASLPVPAQEGLALVPGDDGAHEKRARVFMEEHDRPFHVLDGPMRQARELYAIQQRERRAVVSERGESCFSLQERAWIEADCGRDLVANLADIQEWLGTTGRNTVPEAAPVDEEGMAALRALGYVR